ncbi:MULTISPECIES: nucleotidyl transferase AbiEii/AbiGii toxin family protein [Rhodococcus]|uniref:nucleotidyl transferase AbiEii/AbiGii toxin family protein n=2 Tax=Nocardiaceae TaxID=85025 RepID=UPI000495F0FD|nr:MULTISPECIES: nucleotidyl transferase AbiEii/AbiGii toxin family protein [Rhodococcus]MCZ4640306.1 nucleotidyl transferase AbiEii/AbiGii toxin family protein [Rhodococcus erythropolis]MDN3456493.1 nucleotidyl transferase AbiEii/AbiGii toxin family protein [Rhodococcus sp. APC 3903]
MSGSRVTFAGDAMAAVVQGVIEVRSLLGGPPVIVGGLAVLSRLSNPHRATVDLDLVDRLLGDIPQLEVLRSANGAEPVEPAAVLLPTPYGSVKVDVLEVRQIEIDHPSDDPGDRLHASAHAWANDTASDMTIAVIRAHGNLVEVTTPVAEPGPLIAMKLQAVMNRSGDKQGTDLLDIVHLALDAATRPAAMAQISSVDIAVARDIALHVNLWFKERREQSLQRIRAAGDRDIAADDFDLVAELLTDATDHQR